MAESTQVSAKETEARKQFLSQLVEHKHYIPTSVAGLYGRGAVFEDLVQKFENLVDRAAAPDNAEKRYFPPVIPRSTLEKAGYLESMPQLCGCVHSFVGNELEHRALVRSVLDGQSWTEMLKGTDLALAPAACYALYPTLSGVMPKGGILIDLSNAYVFRREPSDDPARLQAFRMRELVRVGEPELVAPWRDTWLERGLEILKTLGLSVASEEAHDPFFGRGGKMRATNQLEQKLKFELKVAICSEEEPTAVTSFNYHRSHFGEAFNISLIDGSPAHSACLGFGAERVALALLKTHGIDPREWPSHIRNQLWQD